LARVFPLGTEIWSRTMLERSICIGAVAAVATSLSSPLAAQTPSDCGILEDLKIEDTNLLSSTVVPAKDDLPEYCRVLGYVRPAINFEVRLPTRDWNGKFYMAGCGAWCGQLESDRPGFTNAPNHGLRRNYATSTMDGGHWAPTRWDVTWAGARDPIARFDFAQRAVTETARVSKEVIAAYYGKAPEKSYFAACSTGGRQANMEAWKYPEDFDGIISGCPYFYAWQWTTAWAWNVKANIGPDGGPVLDFAKLPMIVEKVYDACAGEDGLIEDPGQCQFDRGTSPAPAPTVRTVLPRQKSKHWKSGTTGQGTAAASRSTPACRPAPSPTGSCGAAWRTSKLGAPIRRPSKLTCGITPSPRTRVRTTTSPTSISIRTRIVWSKAMPTWRRVAPTCRSSRLGTVSS
jgi:feruloyl esterase